MAGIIEALPALTAICNPTYNSKKRLQPSKTVAAYGNCWGFENHETTIRVIKPK